MSNPADAVYSTNADVRTATKRHDSEHQTKLLEYLRNSQRFWARIKSKDKDQPDRYIVDVFSSPGFGDTIYQDVTAFQLDLSDKYAVGNRVRCYLIDGIAYIIGLALPRGTGQYRVLMIIDEENPGSTAFDRPRLV